MARKKEELDNQVENGFLETRTLRRASPADLMRDNPAALIVNKESYRLMSSGFSTRRFDPPQVARVLTYSADGEEVFKDFIIDGMTRTKFADDNAARIEENNPGFLFRVNDVTQDVIGNPDVVPASERHDGQNALSLVQYLRAVIPPTVEHTKIAPDRIAAHLINGWRNMVGEQIAERYSAVAALNLLTHPNTNIATDQALQRELQKQIPHMTGETEEESSRLQDRFQNALIQMAQIIRQSKLNKPEIAKAAYILVATDSEVIGGEKETARQVYGMLHSPDVEQKLIKAYPGEGIGERSERELAREELGARIAGFFRVNKDKRNIGELMRTFNSAYQDLELNIHQLNDILGSDEPIQRYVEIKSEINKGKLQSKYRDQILKTNKRDLSDTEIRLLHNLGSRQYLSDSEIQGLVKVVSTAQNEITKARGQVVQFMDEAERGKLISAGVSPKLIDQALRGIAEVEEEILSATSTRTVTAKAQELRDSLANINRQINYQRSSHTISILVDRISGAKFAEGHGGSQARQSAINYVVGKFDIIDENNQDARRMTEQLVALDPDLFNDVINNNIRLNTALDEQRKRRTAEHASQPMAPLRSDAVVQSPNRVVVPSPSGRPEVSRPQPASVEATRPVSQPDSAEETIVFTVLPDKEDLNTVRVEKNREKLDALIRDMNEGLSKIDLDSNELTSEQKRELEGLIDRLGEFTFGRKGTSRIVKEDYPAMVAKEIARQEARVAGDNADSHRTTQTER